jgi:NhaP-type Na+/H+ and K+/H+ antiporter
MPKGLVPAVLASIPLQRGLYQGIIILDLGFSIVLLSIVITSILVIIISFNPDFFKNMFNRKNNKIIRESNVENQNINNTDKSRGTI